MFKLRILCIHYLQCICLFRIHTGWQLCSWTLEEKLRFESTVQRSFDPIFNTCGVVLTRHLKVLWMSVLFWSTCNSPLPAKNGNGGAYSSVQHNLTGSTTWHEFWKSKQAALHSNFNYYFFYDVTLIKSKVHLDDTPAVPWRRSWWIRLSLPRIQS